MALLNNDIEAGTRPGIAGWIALMAAVLLLSACVTIPIQEMSDARQAIAAAEDVGAERYAANSLNSAAKLMAMAEDDLATKDYTHAREAANEAKKFARRARDLAGVFAHAKIRMQQASTIGAPLTEARRLLAEAQRAATAGHEVRANELLQELERELGQVLEQTQDEQARRFIDLCGARERGMSLPQQSTLTAARGALQEGDVERAYELAHALASEMGVAGEGVAADDAGSDGDGG